MGYHDCLTEEAVKIYSVGSKGYMRTTKRNKVYQRRHPTKARMLNPSHGPAITKHHQAIMIRELTLSTVGNKPRLYIMRLLHTSEYCLYEFIGDKVPPYAILSHTWGKEEVTLHDFLAGKRSEKILRCCQFAASESWKYVWIDTCCIDKSSSAELSEAINSMYSWYQRSEVCYAYLEDIPVAVSFSESRWFTRGWTLQELLAPQRVIFLDHDWRPLGSKKSMDEEVSMATRIERSQLISPLNASVAAKMSWMSHRKTTRIEDVAYCLLGLFEVNMPLLYGEGERAFTRLQEEIIRRSDDQSIFAWTDKSLVFSGMLARHPSAFADSGDIVQARNASYAQGTPYRITNKGLEIQFPVFDGYYECVDASPVEGEFGRFEVPLDCRRSSDEAKIIFITLKQYVSGEAFRLNLFSINALNLPNGQAERKNRTFFVASGFLLLSTFVPYSMPVLWETPFIITTEAMQRHFPLAEDLPGAFIPESGAYSQGPGSENPEVIYHLVFDMVAHGREHECVDDTLPISDRESGSVLFYGNQNVGFLLYWSSLYTYSPPEIKICRVSQPVHDSKGRLVLYLPKRALAVLSLEGRDVWTSQLWQNESEHLFVRLRNVRYSQGGQQRLVVDVDVVNI